MHVTCTKTVAVKTEWLAVQNLDATQWLLATEWIWRASCCCASFSESKVATLQAVDMGKLEYQQVLCKVSMFICKPLTANVVYKRPLSAVKNLLHFLSPCFNGRQGPAPDVYDLGPLIRWGDPYIASEMGVPISRLHRLSQHLVKVIGWSSTKCKMKGTEVPNPQRSSAWDYTCVLTKNRSLSCDSLILAMRILFCFCLCKVVVHNMT